MSNLAAVVTGLALASILVAAVSVRPRAGGEARPSTPIAFEARLEVPVPPKADRLPLPLPPVIDEPPLLKADPIVPAQAGIAVAQLKPAAPRDPVCGPRGRVWYTKANGWKYWRCTR